MSEAVQTVGEKGLELQQHRIAGQGGVAELCTAPREQSEDELQAGGAYEDVGIDADQCQQPRPVADPQPVDGCRQGCEGPADQPEAQPQCQVLGHKRPRRGALDPPVEPDDQQQG